MPSACYGCAPVTGSALPAGHVDGVGHVLVLKIREVRAIRLHVHVASGGEFTSRRSRIFILRIELSTSGGIGPWNSD
jgi:hypothetical protein